MYANCQRFTSTNNNIFNNPWQRRAKFDGILKLHFSGAVLRFRRLAFQPHSNTHCNLINVDTSMQMAFVRAQCTNYKTINSKSEVGMQWMGGFVLIAGSRQRQHFHANLQYQLTQLNWLIVISLHHLNDKLLCVAWRRRLWWRWWKFIIYYVNDKMCRNDKLGSIRRRFDRNIYFVLIALAARPGPARRCSMHGKNWLVL